MKYTTRAKIGKAVTETLEDRKLYSTVSLQDGVLSLALDRPDTVIVDFDGSPDRLWAYAGGRQTRVDTADVRSIVVTGSAGNDIVFINPNLKTPTHMELGAGNDTVRGSGGNDTILAGDGNDMIFSRDGNDVVDGGNGNDVIWGGNGNDSLYGGAGSDKVDGSGGRNVVSQNGKYTAPVATPVPVKTETPPIAPPATPVVNLPQTPVVDDTPVTPAPVEQTKDDALAPVVKVSFVRQSVAAGQTMHAHGLDTELKSGTILTAKFEWSFGDGSNTTLVGWNVAHTYEKAGTYQMTLKVTDDAGHVTIHNETIKITEAQRTKIFVSANGNDNNDGLTEQTALRTVAKAASKVNDNVEILFRRGDKFTVTENIAIADTNVVIGAYGTGNRPILWRMEGNGGGVISIWLNSVDVTVRDITFDSPYAANGNTANKNGITGIFAGGKNITVSGCEFLNVTDAVNSDRDVAGLLVENNSAPLSTGLRGYLVWGEGTDHVYLNNYVANSTREHCIRMNALDRLLVSGNDFANTDRSAVDKDDFSKGSIEVHEVKHAYVTRNTVRDGGLRAGPRGGSTEAKSTSTDWVVFDSNTAYNVGIAIRPGAHHVMVRNNVVNNNGGEAIIIYKPDSDGRVSSDITIDNNTAVNNDAVGKFLWLQGRADGVTLTDNMYVAPNLKPADNGAAPVYVAMNDLSAFRQIGGNVWPSVTGYSWSKGGINYVGESWGLTGAYQTANTWEDNAVVQGDQFVNVDKNTMYSYKVGNSTIGSTLRLAA